MSGTTDRESFLMSDGTLLHHHGCPKLAGRRAWPVDPATVNLDAAALCPRCFGAAGVPEAHEESGAGPRIAVLYVSRHGQAAKVAESVAATMRERGARVDVQVPSRRLDPAVYDGLVVGGSVHFSRHSRRLVHFLRNHAEELVTIPTAVFQVSLTSAVADEEHHRRADALLRQLLEQTGIDPILTGLFGGAVAYTSYNRFLRRVMRATARSEGLDTDTRADHEYTDWNAVRDFARDVVIAVRADRAARRGTGRPVTPDGGQPAREDP